MGVYVFRSRCADWIKVGHHKIRDNAPNVYYRVIRRGFYSCKRPEELKDKVSFDDLELLCWYPNLISKDEYKLHFIFRKKYVYIGEWYTVSYLDEIKEIIENYGGTSVDDLAKAHKWLELKSPLRANRVLNG